MGFFSWETSDTKRSIANCHSSRETFPVYLLLPEGGYLEELEYDGYGCFGGHDVYALVAKWNFPEKCTGDEDEDRHLGIEIACHDEDNAALKYPIKLVEDKTLCYNDVDPSINCPDQGFFYDDEDYEDGEDDWDEEDYEEDEEDEEEDD